MNRIFVSLIGSLFIAGCSPNNNESQTRDVATCIGTDSALFSSLDSGMRGRVKFVGEPERLYSIQNKMTEYGIPEMSLTVINGGVIETSQNYPIPVEANQCNRLFQAASLSKPVTVMAAMRMQTSGEIDLDRDIQDYLRNFSLPEGAQTNTDRVTLRNVFTHTSGITPGGYQGYARSTVMPSDVDILRGAEGVNSARIEVISKPNQYMAYSGGGYTLAELALQDHFDESFEKLMNDWLLDPIGMADSEFSQPLHVDKYQRVAMGHAASGDSIDGGWHNYPEQAAAGLWSTSHDLAKFMIEIYRAYHGESTIFSQELINQMLEEERDRSVYGFIVDRSNDGLSITHYGGNAGYRTGMTIDLVTGNGLVYLTNSDNGGNLGNELLLSAAQVYGWNQFAQVEVERATVETEILASLAGDYKWNGEVDVRIAYDSEAQQLSLFFPNGDEYRLDAIVGENLDFVHASTGVQLSFLSEYDYQTFTLYGRNAERVVSVMEGTE